MLQPTATGRQIRHLARWSSGLTQSRQTRPLARTMQRRGNGPPHAGINRRRVLLDAPAPGATPTRGYDQAQPKERSKGEFAGKRLVSERSVEFMTTDHIPKRKAVSLFGPGLWDKHDRGYAFLVVNRHEPRDPRGFGCDGGCGTCCYWAHKTGPDQRLTGSAPDEFSGGSVRTC